MLIHIPFIQFVARHFFASFHSHCFIEYLSRWRYRKNIYYNFALRNYSSR